MQLHQKCYANQSGCFPRTALVAQSFNSNVHAQVCKSLQQLSALAVRSTGRVVLYAIRAKETDIYAIILYK